MIIVGSNKTDKGKNKSKDYSAQQFFREGDLMPPASLKNHQKNTGHCQCHFSVQLGENSKAEWKVVSAHHH